MEKKSQRDGLRNCVKSTTLIFPRCTFLPGHGLETTSSTTKTTNHQPGIIKDLKMMMTKKEERPGG